ncbi:hypothetical protein LTR49_028833, partial [Elasticomyces elasticus]
FPKPLFRSYNSVGLDDAVCFDRHSRYRPYGLGGKSVPAAAAISENNQGEVDWSTVSWGSLQEQCLSENPGPESHDAHQSHGRSAVLIRTWDTYQYQENDLQAIRSLVSELSLQSRGQYEVFLFVHVKDNSLP